MPLYEYLCASCGRRFEELRRMEDRARAECPDCGAEAELTLSAFSAVNGSGSSQDFGDSSGSCCSSGSCGCGD